MSYFHKFIHERELRTQRMNTFKGRSQNICSQWRGKGNHNSFIGVKNTKVFLIGKFSPGQGLMLHMIISTAFPSHGRPPFWADGLLQVLVLVRLPRPQLLVHSSQGLHSDQLPSTIQRWNITPSDIFQLKALILRQSTVREQKWVSMEHVPIRWVKKCTWTQLMLTVSHFWIQPLARLPTIGWEGAVAQTTSLLDAFSTGDTAGSPGRPLGKSTINCKENIVLCICFCKWKKW